MSEFQSIKPATFWEERAIVCEQAMIRMFTVLASHVPHAQPELIKIVDEWDGIITTMTNEYRAKDEAQRIEGVKT